MTTIDALTANSAQASKAQAQKSQLNQDFDDFLTLLTTQLQNQDPLDPMDSNEFTNQLVQFSQVEQQLATNDILEDMRALDVLRITDIGLGFVGMDVQVAGNRFEFDGTNDADLGYNIPRQAGKTTITIKDQNGQTVYTMDGETSTGTKTFSWDGTNNDGFKVDPGRYYMEVAASDLEGESLAVQTNVPGRVDGIENDGNGNTMLLIGDMRIPITDVTRATLPRQVVAASN